MYTLMQGEGANETQDMELDLDALTEELEMQEFHHCLLAED